mmetsp:Transcript_348/g.596  ORF Transcript_348/g.596 Transcript_348/m.596 type:complete len:106 (-) Transcript_348:23-340(-)
MWQGLTCAASTVAACCSPVQSCTLGFWHRLPLNDRGAEGQSEPSGQQPDPAHLVNVPGQRTPDPVAQCDIATDLGSETGSRLCCLDGASSPGMHVTFFGLVQNIR